MNYRCNSALQLEDFDPRLIPCSVWVVVQDFGAWMTFHSGLRPIVILCTKQTSSCLDKYGRCDFIEISILKHF